MDILQKIKADYDGKKMRKVAVPEWDAEIYFNPLTLAERKRIAKGHDPKDDAGLTVSLLIEKALDADGKRIFDGSAETRAALEGATDAAVIARVVTQMGAAQTHEEAKND